MKTKKLKMNVRLLRRVRKRILSEPRQFQMERFVIDRLWSGSTIPNCGTAACIYGWGVALNLRLKPRYLLPTKRKFRLVDADELFGISEDAAVRLIWFDEWPKRFRKVGIHKEGTAAFARQAAHRIDHFIKTKGAE